MIEVVLESILEIINSAIIVINKNTGEVKLANKKARLIFKDNNGFLMKTCFDNLFHPDNHLDAQNIIHFCNIHGEFEGEVLLKRQDDAYFVAMISCSSMPYKDNDIDYEHIIIVLHDISRLKGMERLLRISKRLASLGDMLDDINHQIRNPILAIGGLAKRLQKHDLINKSYIDAILLESFKLEKLLNKSEELINLTRPKPVAVKLSEIAKSAEIIVKEFANEFSIPISFESKLINNDKAAVFDITTLRPVLFEIIKNAIDSYHYIEREPKIHLAVEESREKRWACFISVTDWGCGIKPQLIDKIFDPFFTTKTGHIGIGLTKSKMILEEQVGKIAIDSIEDEGTTIRIYIQKELRTIPRAPTLDNLK